MTFRQVFESYLTELAAERHITVPETAHYDLIKKLLNAAGEDLSPEVRAVVHPSSTGAGIPDLALFADNQEDGQKPSHGVIEVKPTGDDIEAVAASSQVADKYVPHYGQVLVTNFYQFVLVTADGAEERYDICKTEKEFWQQVVLPGKLAKQHADALKEYLLRVMRRSVPLTDPKDVAWILASYAREAKARIDGGGVDLSALENVRIQLENALGVHFEHSGGEDFFRSTLVQTLFYGIFSAWVLWHENKEPGSDEKFQLWRHTRDLNVPAIQELFEEVTRASRLRPLNIEELLEWTSDALNRVQPAFFDRFERGEAIQYFYEPFLEAFDPELRKQLGVWYTPPQVVQYMVARVDVALKDELGIERGLLDEDVYVLDPCCGTGAYLVEVLRHIYRKAAESEGQAMAGQIAQKALIGGEDAEPRIFGFELLPAPFVVAHLQIGMLLREMRAPMPSGERAGIYLTNALTGWGGDDPDQPRQKEIDWPELRKERDAAEKVKQKTPILVILGNPPYSGFAGMAIEEERELSNAYRETKRAPKPQGQGLNDLYVRFYRMAERKIVESTKQGIVCYISNYSWLDGLSHTGMRERYLDVFDTVIIDSLNGDKYRTGKTIPAGYPDAGAADPSIFSTPFNREGIQVGTAIALLTRKKRDAHGSQQVDFRNLWGRSKLAQLESEADVDVSLTYQTMEPQVKLGYPFMPRITGENYLDWPKLPELFPESFQGVSTGRDAMLIDIDREALVRRIQLYFDKSVSHEEMRRINSRVMKETSSFSPLETRDHIRNRGYCGLVLRHIYRPFDIRWLYWDTDSNLLDRERAEYFPHAREDNLWIVSQRKPTDEQGLRPQAKTTVLK